MKNKILLATGLSVLLLSTYITQDKIFNKISSNYKEKVNSLKFFNIDKDNKDYTKFKIDKNKPILIIYDKFINENHGNKILNIINYNNNNSNIFLFDINSKRIYNKELKVLKENANFYQFLYSISQNNLNSNITLNMSINIILNENNYQKNKNFIFKYNLNFVDFVYKLKNIKVNKSFGNISGKNLRKSLLTLLNKFDERILLINNIDKNITYEEININKIKKHFNKEFNDFKTLNPTQYARFMKEYILYKKEIKYEAIDTYSIIYALKYLNLENDNKFLLIKGISINNFKFNYQNIDNIKFPNDLNDFYNKIKNLNKISIENNLDIIFQFNKLNKKYYNKYPSLYRTKYDVGLEQKKSSNFNTSLNEVYFKEKKLEGTSFSTALMTLTDFSILQENKLKKKKEIKDIFF